MNRVNGCSYYFNQKEFIFVIIFSQAFINPRHIKTNLKHQKPQNEFKSRRQADSISISY